MALRPQVLSVLVCGEGPLTVAKVVVKLGSLDQLKMNGMKRVEDLVLRHLSETIPEIRWWEHRTTNIRRGKGNECLIVFREAPLERVR